MEEIWIHGKGLIKKMSEVRGTLKKLGIKIKRQNPAQDGQDDLVLIRCSKETLRVLQVLTKAKLHG
jgi:hypothetical protein